MLQATRFKPGFTYENHASGDKDSHLGLKALVIGGGALLVAKKTGILLVILLFLKKGFIVVIAAVGGFFKWLFGRRRKRIICRCTSLRTIRRRPEIRPSTAPRLDVEVARLRRPRTRAPLVCDAVRATTSSIMSSVASGL